jgi:hypothetical protein
MTTSELLSSAEKLNQPSAAAAQEFEEKRELLAAELNRVMSSREDVAQLVGEGNRGMMEDNHRNHARFMASLFREYRPQALVETVLWVYRAYRSHGFHLTYWPAQLDQWVELFKSQLSKETYGEIYPFYDWMIIHQPDFVQESDKIVLSSDVPSHGN